MKLISRIVWGILFIVVFGLALKNMHETALLLFLGYEIKSPLALILLGFLMSGFILGVLAMTPTLFRHRREMAKQKKAINKMEKDSAAQQVARSQPPPDTVVGA